MSESVNAALDDLGRISKHQKFDDNKPVTLFLHGYKNNQQTPAVKKVVEAYISNGEHNLIVLDWADATAGTYVDAYKNVEPVNYTLLSQTNRNIVLNFHSHLFRLARKSRPFCWTDSVNQF